MVLIGRDLSGSSMTPDVLDDSPAVGDSALDGADAPALSVGRRVPEQLRPLLDGAADPVRTVWLLQQWLDATDVGVALVWASSDLSVMSANRALEDWIPREQFPFEGKPWRTLWPSGDADRLAAAAEDAIRTGDARTLAGYALTDRVADILEAY